MNIPNIIKKRNKHSSGRFRTLYQGLTVFKSLCYLSCSCLYWTKLINVVNKCGKKVEEEKSEAIVGQNVHVRVLNVHI